MDGVGRGREGWEEGDLEGEENSECVQGSGAPGRHMLDPACASCWI
jgi:hypothetical protein